MPLPATARRLSPKDLMSASSLELRKNWFVLSSLVSRDFKLKYRRSMLGVAWSILNPLLMMAVMTAVFQNIFRWNIPMFALYLILGQTLFALMANSTSGGLWAIISNAGLIKKIRIEKALFPIQKVFSELINFALSLVGVVAVMIWFKVTPGPPLLLLPVLLVYMIIFCTGLCLALSALAVFFRDMIHLWGVFILMWTYLTPIFYPIEGVPAWLRSIERFNPMFQYIRYFRNIVMYDTVPDLRANAICLAIALISFVIGLLIFRASSRRFILYV